MHTFQYNEHYALSKTIPITHMLLKFHSNARIHHLVKWVIGWQALPQATERETEPDARTKQFMDIHIYLNTYIYSKQLHICGK